MAVWNYSYTAIAFILPITLPALFDGFLRARRNYRCILSNRFSWMSFCLSF